MNKYILVFNKEDKEKLIKKGFSYIGIQGNSFLFKNNTDIRLEGDILIVTTNKICL